MFKSIGALGRITSGLRISEHRSTGLIDIHYEGPTVGRQGQHEQSLRSRRRHIRSEMPLRRERSALSSALAAGTTSAYAGIRRSERLASKAAHFLDCDSSTLYRAPESFSRTYRSFANNVDQDLDEVRGRRSGDHRSAKTSPTPANATTMEESMAVLDENVLAVGQSMSINISEAAVSTAHGAASVTSAQELKRRSVRMSIRKGLQPLANILTTNRKKREVRLRRSSMVENGQQNGRPANIDVNNNMSNSAVMKSHIYMNPTTIAMEHRAHRNTICLSTVDLSSVNLMSGLLTNPRTRPPQLPLEKSLSTSTNPNPDHAKFNDNNTNCANKCLEFRVPMVPPEPPRFPQPLPRTSLLRQENVPPLPPPRRRSPRFSHGHPSELLELRKYEPSRVFGLRELPANSPKRRMCFEPAAECAADDENSFVLWPGNTSGGMEVEKKRRKTVRFQDNNACLHRSDPPSGKAKLQLCLYINYGHLSVHGEARLLVVGKPFIRGANLPLLPDQHELNSYVKVTLEPKDLRSQHRSQLVSGTVDPSYDFRLSFELPPNAEEERSLLITVWHRNCVTKQSRLLGFLSFAVKKIVAANRIDGWFRLPSLAITKKTRM
ncbi:hypothetical protein BIW11_10971 [Tropilaelaps mercedesae]|uniref:C2 domain-containing protein n=1 Tax=Tropilaelaps mercedesae TaxID=418985 RepID=A0A1V9XDP4_9ACAR|nr:hypothetical protein BIW11_10971 [Tropilaelaps mercedesae]